MGQPGTILRRRAQRQDIRCVTASTVFHQELSISYGEPIRIKSWAALRVCEERLGPSSPLLSELTLWKWPKWQYAALAILLPRTRLPRSSFRWATLRTI